MPDETNLQQPTAQTPLLPPEPWYASAVQRGFVIAMASQVVSIFIRWFGLPVTDAELAVYSADVLQIVTIGFGVYALIKRQTSTIQPLTMTRKGADARAESSQLDPTTFDKTKPSS